MTMVAQRRLTPHDLLAHPEGDHLELVAGEFLERRVGSKASCTAFRLASHLGRWAEQHSIGKVFEAGCGYRCFPWDRDQVRRPDVSFVPDECIPDGVIPEHFFAVPPALAALILSPELPASQVRVKTRDFLRAGTRLVWVIDPETRDVEVFRADGSGAIIPPNGQLSGEDVLPGFSVAVSDLFPFPARRTP